MDSWSDVVTSYPENPEPKDYAKAVRTVEITLSRDLAPFETEWLAQTLLFKPVCLFDTITSKCVLEDWLKNIADSFKILAKIVEKCWDVVEAYYEDIIKLCMLSFDPQTRKEAIWCLARVLQHPSVDVSEEFVHRHVAGLEQATTCKAPLAQLVGTICRYHPERVQEHYIRIWRTYLNMLQPKNKTDQVVNAVLQGMNGLFEHFGDDIPMDQLNSFYDMMSRECIRIPKCLEVVLLMLTHHARLFKERIGRDAALRMYLWQLQTKSAVDALCSVYEVVLSQVDDKERILSSEVVPRARSQTLLTSSAALRVLIQASAVHTVNVDKMSHGIDLEFQLRTKKLSYDEANIVSWCIESSVSNSETMLLTAIMFYDNLPTTKKKEILVNGILKASDDVRKSALVLLLKLSLQDLDRYIDVWRVLLDNTTGPDLGKAVIIFEEALHHILEILVSLTGDTAKIYADIKPILYLMGVLLSLHKTEFNTGDWWQSFKPTLIHISKLFNVDTVQMVTENTENEMIYVEKFEEDTVLSKFLLTLSTSLGVGNNGTLSDFQTIFSNENTEYKVLSKVLSKLELLIETDKNNLDKKQLSMILNKISVLKYKTGTDSKDARIFQMDVSMFLGKYGHLTEEENFSEDVYVLKLKNKINLKIPNIIEGTTFKIDLQRVLQLCLIRGDIDALYSLLAILSANLCDRIDPGVQESTVRVIHALFRCNVGRGEMEVSVYPALLMCNTTACVQVIMKGITEELNPTVRRKLSDCLEVLLSHEPGSETTVELLRVVAEQTTFIMTRDEATTNNPGLDIIKAFLISITDNNALIIEYLPNIITYTSNIHSPETFEQSTNIFIGNIDIFTEIQIKNTIKNVIEKFSTNIAYTESHLNKILNFLQRLVEIKKIEALSMVDMTLDKCQNLTVISPQFLNLVTLLAFLNRTFNFEKNIRKKVVCFENSLVIEQLLKIKFDEDDIRLNAALIFLKEYAEELLEMNEEKTLESLSNIIENIPPKSVAILKNNLTLCLSRYKRTSNYLPIMKKCYEKWCKKFDLQNFTEHIEEGLIFSEYSEQFSELLLAVKIFSELIDVPKIEVKNWTSVLIEKLSVDDFKWGRIFISDILFVSNKYLTNDDFSTILDNNMSFVKQYINVYFERIICKPFVLKVEHSSLLTDVVEFFSTHFKEDYFENVLDLIDHLWPSFVENSIFDDKLTVLLHVLRLPKTVSLEFLPVKWTTTLLLSESTSLEDRIKLIAALPAGDEYSTYRRHFASCLPVLVSEMQGRYMPPYRALLDSLASTGDMTLLDIVITLAGGDDSKGWWDYAIDACMNALATKEDIKILDQAYKKTKNGFNLDICNRIFLPLLRHSSRKFCEKYISTIVTDLFNVLRVGFKQTVYNEPYRKRITSYTIVFNILKVVFEKMSTESLENGVLNECAGSQKPWYFLEQTCKYCVTISNNVKCPTDVTSELKNTCLWLQCSSYNCFATAICRRKLSKNLSARVFNAQVWANIVDKEAVYTFDLKAYAKYKGTKPAKQSVDVLTTSSSLTGTVRSRLFLTTLSENPLQFDMIPEDEDEEEDEEDDISIEFEDSVLNAHGCLTTLTSLLEHASTLEHTDWRSALATALTSDLTLNAKWLLAQAICNAEEALKPHASALCVPLLQLIGDTPSIVNGKHVLNNLHVDIITTIIKWNISDIPPTSYLNTTVEYVINTYICYKQQYNIQKRLLNTLNGVLQVFGNLVKVKWSIFQDYCTDLPKDLLPLLSIFERLLKQGISLPELLPAIFTSTDAKIWHGTTKLAEVSGLALSLTDSDTRKQFLAIFWQILASIRSSNVNSYVKILFYVQKNCKDSCDLYQLRIITDLASKVEKSKCLLIISTYLEHSTELNEFYSDIYQIISLQELFDSELRTEAMRVACSSLKFMNSTMKNDILKGMQHNCKNSSVNVRKEAFGVFLKAFQDLVKRENSNPFKRKAVDSSPILDIMSSEKCIEKLIVSKIFDGLFDEDDTICTMITDGLEQYLSKDMTMRFAELFYVIIYQCSLSTKNLELANCGSKLLELLIKDLTNQDAFKVIQLRDEGLPQSILKAYESSTVRTKTIARTVLRTGVTYRQRINKAPARREINVQMCITEIIDVFLQLSKTNSQICQELCGQMMKCLKGIGRRFDLDSVMAKQLFDIIKRDPFCLTPLVLDASRVFIKDISSIPGFADSVVSLQKAVSNSEGYLYTKILFEDLQLRSGDRNQFIISMFKEDIDAAMRDQEFTLQGLIDVFGSLSNWDDLRMQDKRQIEDSLPPLWTRDEDFTLSLRQYFDEEHKKLDYGQWFNKIIASYYADEVTQNRMSWLNHIEKWPQRNFVTSAVMEAIQWHQNDAKIFGEISSTDCLAEWAARLMIRSVYYNQQMDSETDKAGCFSKDELIWCREANNRGMPSIALQAIDRNKKNLLDNEVLPWAQEMVTAYKIIGLRENNVSCLQKALDSAEKQIVSFGPQSSFETNISMQTVILQLHHDLESLSKDKLDFIMQAVNMNILREKTTPMSTRNTQVLKSFYDTAMIYYDEQWNDDERTQNEIILKMAEIIDTVLDHNLATDYNLLLSVLLNRLAYFETTISDVTAIRFLQQIYRIFHRLDFFSVAILKKVLSVLPTNVLKESYLDKLQDANLDVCKEYFRLICDPNYSLWQYCSELRKNILDEDEWNTIFNRMKTRLFETKHGGTEYQSLNTMKNRLYALENTTAIDTKAKELKLIIDELRTKSQRTTLLLSQLCPDLCTPAILDRKRSHLQRLLRLPPNVHVVKFAEQISVYTDSIRRPCVLKALLSNGTIRRYICKSGEPMYRDASVQRTAAILPVIHANIPVRNYNVTPLGEDSAIIEYLEDHVRLRVLMEEKHNIDVPVNKMGYEKLILAPSLALEQYYAMCDKVTPYILRSAIEESSSCVKEFIIKKRNFEDTLSSMTILNWLFGVGDRHLHNIMYSIRDGGVCSVDWASVFQYGCQELPPARLTANLLAVCDVKVLESRLQKTLSSLRNSQRLLNAFIRTSFYWAGPEFIELKHTQNILQGKSVCYEITRECIDESERKYKHEYIELLDHIFEHFTPKEKYSVEEQVSCLLQLCTEPRVLAVTPPGWEAWL